MISDNANGHHYTGEPVKKLRKRKERKSSKTIPGDSSEYTDENSDNERTETLLNVPQDIKPKENCAERSVPTQPNDVERVSDVPLKTVNENSNSIIVNHNDHAQKTDDQAQDLKTSSTLKADAEEFIPRGFQPLAPPPNLKILPPNFMPIPLVPLGAPHPAAFIPPGFPINFIPQPMGQKMFPPTPNFVPYPPPVVPEQATESLNEVAPQDTERESTATPSHTPTVDDGKTLQVHSKTIDIATVVSKLEAVKLERHGDATKAVINESKPFRNAPRLGSKPPTFKKHYYNNNKFRNSPVRSGDATPGDAGSPQHFRLSPARSVQNVETTTSSHHVKPEQNITERQQKVRSWKNHESPIKRYNNPMYQRSPEKTPTPVRNNVQPFRKSFILNGQNKKPEESKPVPVVEQPKTETTKLKPNSQWISVSSRKKKKNKSVDGEIDNDDHEAPTCDESSDLFETYDVNQLVDVVPPLKEDDKTIEEILISMAPQAEVSKPLDIVIPEVREIERTLLDKVVEEVEPTETKEPQIVNTKTPQIKKSKKGTQKPLLKKVIITDIFKEPETPVIEAPTKKTVAAPIENTKVTVEKEVTPEPESEPQDKKPKRKKNKSKSSKTNSSSDQTTKEDTSYLLINEELTLEKTNDEISLELDQLIQKGMYSSLQKKIKTINVEPDMDAFFKTMGVGAKPAPVMKAPDFNRIFQSTRQFLKPNMVSVEHQHSTDMGVADNNIKTCSSAADAADPSSGHVLENVVAFGPETPADDDAPPQADKTLYPITEAVKEWMCRTRETTPDVDILKSPSDIQKEFYPIDCSDDEDEEVTLFASDETLNEVEEDLLEYWDNDVSIVVSKDCDLSKDINGYGDKVCADGKCCDKCRTDSIKQGDEEIEVYESKYGQSETFLRMQDNEKKNEGPRLPHRAVCCSLQ